MSQVSYCAGLNPEPTVEVLYPAKSTLGECPFYEEETNTLLWVDIEKHTINFLDLATNTNRYSHTHCIAWDKDLGV